MVGGEGRGNRKPVALTIKGDLEWRRWLERAAAHCEQSVSDFVEAACAREARVKRYGEKPPRRLS